MSADGAAPIGSYRSVFAGRAGLWLAFAAVILALLIGKADAIIGVLDAFILPDSDDAMRLVRVRDLLAGQDWFDPIQHRYFPPNGGSMHWSRLWDVPTAGGIGLLTAVLGATLAEKLTVILVPVLALALFVALVIRIGAQFFWREAAAYAALATALVGPINFAFSPGRIDHHGAQLVLALAVVGSCLSLGRSWRWSFTGGAAAGLSLAVGLEMLPLIALAGMLHVGFWIGRGREAAEALLAFASGMAAIAVLAFVAQTDPATWLVPVCDALSLPWLLLCLAALAVVVLLIRIGRQFTIRGRLVAAAVGGAAIATGFALLYPQCLNGPYHDLPPAVRDYWLRTVGEAMPFATALRLQTTHVLGTMGPQFTAAVLATVLAFRAAPDERTRLVILAAFVWLSLGLTLVETRAIVLGLPAVPLIAGVAIATLLRPKRMGARARIGLAVLSLLMLAPIWAAAGSIANAGRAAEADGGGYGPALACAAPAEIEALNALPTGLILAQPDIGPAILQRTLHSIVAAPYHRNVTGLAASVAAFRGGEAELRAVLSAVGADYLVACRAMVLAGSPPDAFVRALLGSAPPSWLTELPGPGDALSVWHVVAAPARLQR